MLMGAATPLNLHSPPRDSSELITLSDAGQNCTRMWCYFHHPWNHFIDYFDNPVPDGVVMYADNVPFQYNEQEDTYIEFLGTLTGNIFLATSRDHEFLLNQKGSTSNVSNNSDKYAKWNFVEKSINIILIIPLVPSELLHPTYNAGNGMPK